MNKLSDREELRIDPKPGMTCDIGGVIFVVVAYKNVPAEYWRTYPKSWSMPSGLPHSLEQAITEGSGTKTKVEWMPDGLCIIPKSFMEKVENEWGEVAP